MLGITTLTYLVVTIFWMLILAVMAKFRVLLVFLYVLSQVCCQVDFNCPPLPPLGKPARNVHELRPQDIKVVMALGDSVTAGIYS